MKRWFPKFYNLLINWSFITIMHGKSMYQLFLMTPWHSMKTILTCVIPAWEIAKAWKRASNVSPARIYKGMTCKFSYQQRKYLRRIRPHWVYIVLAEVWVKTFVQTKNVLQSHSLTWSLSIWSAIIHTLWSRRLVVDNKKEKLLKHSLIKKTGLSLLQQVFVFMDTNGHSACINFGK